MRKRRPDQKPSPAAGGADSARLADAPPRLEMTALTKRFGPKTAVDRVDLVVEPGTFLVLLGPSGSGKSTLLRCLAGIERATTGAIYFDSLQVDGPAGHLPPERRDLAMVFQDYALWPHLTAEQNVAFALKRWHMGTEERRSRSRAMLDQVGLAGLHDRYPAQLSGGEQQRVALARALVGRPGLLLFDEPLSNLDADRREQLRVDIGTMVREQGATAVYITHDQAEAFALADVVGVLRAGRLVQLGRPEDIYQCPADAFVARFTGLAGELPGRVTTVDAGPHTPGRVVVDIGGATVRGRPLSTGRFQPGDRVRVLVRPSAVRFADMPDEAGPKLDRRGITMPRSVSAVPVVVRDAAFRGWGYEHVIELAGGQRLGGVPAGRRMPFASPAVVLLTHDGCMVVEDDSKWDGIGPAAAAPGRHRGSHAPTPGDPVPA